MNPLSGAAFVPQRSVWRRRLLQTLGWSMAALCSLLLLAWLILHWGILNHIEQWRGQIEHSASEALGVAVRIGHIEVRSGSWIPAVDLRDVAVHDASGREALRLPKVSASLAPVSLLAFEVRLRQVVLDAAELEVRRDASDRVFVGGLQVNAASAPGESGMTDWFFGLHELVVRGGSLHWIDEQRNAPMLTLTGVDLVLRQGARRREIRLDATPPIEWGERFSIQGHFMRPMFAAGWSRASGTLSVHLPHTDLRGLRRHLDLPFELNEGEGALRGWLQIDEGAPRELTLDLALSTVSLRLASHLQPLALRQLEGRVIAQRGNDGVRLTAERFGFVTAEGKRWPRSNLQLAWQQRQHARQLQPVTSGELSAEQLDLALLSGIAERLPLGDALHRLLAEVKAKGNVNGLSASWSGPVDAPTKYQAQARIEGLSLEARSAKEPGTIGRPGLTRADVDLTLSEAGGDAQLSVSKGSVELPGVFEEARVALDRLTARLAWTIAIPSASQRPRIEVTVRDATFANDDVEGSLKAVWRTGDGSGLGRGGRLPGQIELTGDIVRGQAARTARYLPLGLPQAVRRYVAHAVQAGTVGATRVRVKGDLWDFPFAGSQGEFRVQTRVENGVFAYVPSTPASPLEPAFRSPWPPLTQVSAELVFDRASMRVENGRARVHGIELANVRGGIDNLVRGPLLRLEGSGAGSLADGLGFVNRTPVGTWIGQSLRDSSAEGTAELHLAFGIPLGDAGHSTVNGSLVLAGNDVLVRPGTPLLAGARGRIDFSERGFAIVGASARAAGGEARFEGGMQPDGSLRFAGHGTASADGLRRMREFGLLSRIAGFLSGQADYRIALGFVHGQPEIRVESDLVGIAADLPAPLGKRPETALPLRYETRLVAEAPSARDLLRFELGSLVQAEYLRDLSGEEASVLRGGIGVNAAAPPAAGGVAANLNVDALNADAWSEYGARLMGTSSGGASPAIGTSQGGSPGYLPSRIALRAGTLQAGSRRLTHVVAGVTRDALGWRANVVCDQLDGHVEYRAPGAAGAGTEGLIYARLKRLALPKGEAEGVESLLDAQPASVPALDIAIDDFELRGKRLGRVQIEATNTVNEPVGTGREWRLARLALTTPEATLSATGRWLAGTGARRAVMNFTLDLGDSGAFLERLGFGHSIRGGKGRLAGDVAWLGSPLSPDLASMTGDVNLALDAGQFLKAEPGAARILGVLSLQSLPRRLALDFRDVFEEGFAFDNVTGDVRIARGVASTNNLRMRGVQAAVLMEGQADIEHETQNLRVLVVPEINAGTASLAYAVINPVIGLGTFLAQVFLRHPLMLAGTREFHVTGSWSEPNVERVQRKQGQALPNLEAETASVPAVTQ